jgi:hypothetical protein
LCLSLLLAQLHARNVIVGELDAGGFQCTLDRIEIVRSMKLEWSDDALAELSSGRPPARIGQCLKLRMTHRQAFCP